MPVYPLSEAVFERMNSLNPPSLHYLKTPVVWNEDVYALGRDCEGDGKLFKYSLSSNEWSNFSIPSSIYASNSVLTTYNSKLLLISGNNMTLWEFSNNDFTFKESRIKPIPTKYCSDVVYDSILTTSSDEYLIITYEMLRISRPYNLLIYNGSDWKSRKLKTGSHSGMSTCMAAVDSHAVYGIVYEWKDDTINIQRILIPRFDEIKDEDMTQVPKEEFGMISLEEFDELLNGKKSSIIVQNKQFYCVDSKGIIFMAFLQPPIIPVVWGNSGVKFDQAPHLVGLPDGALLMIGTISNQDGESQLDIIKVSQKGITILYFVSHL